MTRNDLKKRISETLDMMDLSKKGAVCLSISLSYDNNELSLCGEMFQNLEKPSIDLLSALTTGKPSAFAI